MLLRPLLSDGNFRNDYTVKPVVLHTVGTDLFDQVYMTDYQLYSTLRKYGLDVLLSCEVVHVHQD